ncbi:hypothetical protein L7F22_040414 [Adiantum nelumboides]|nr:hypothetical protein [Adiantum nelumboides]
MKRSPSDKSVYDFDEGDVEPFSAKRNRKELFQSFFKGIQEVTGGRKNERIKIKKTTKRPKKRMYCGSVIVRDINANQLSSVPDIIETDDSDSESNQRRQNLEMRFGGVVGVPNGVFRHEDLVAEQSVEVGIQGKELWVLDEKYNSPELIFTASAIEFKIQAFGAVKLPLSMLQNFGSGSHEEGPFFIKLDLTEDGAKFLQQHLGRTNDYTLCNTIYSTFSDNNLLAEKIKQITSLSDGYKSKWRPGIEHAMHHQETFVNVVHRDSDGNKNGEKEYSLGECILYRSREILDNWCDLIYPTEDDRDAVTVTKYDYILLDPDQFLSDTIVDFYIKYVQSKIPEADKDRFYFYNSFFFRKLTEADKNLHNEHEKSKLFFERVKRWTAGINIFDKEYLFIPIMQSAHWSLVIICHPGYSSAGCSNQGFEAPTIWHLDSLEGCHTSVEEPIRSYLVEAWRERNSHNEDAESFLTWKFVALKVPQQTNYSDCGLFLLHYVELYVKEVLEKNSTDIAFQEWFNPVDASRKRAHIQSLIQGLKAKKSAGEHLRSYHFTDTYGVKPSEISQREISFGRCVCDLNACTRLGHDHVELQCVEVVGGQHNNRHCCQRASFDEREHGAAVNHVKPILMPFSTNVENNCVVQTYGDYVLLDDSLECSISDVNPEDIHAPVREANNQPDEFVAKEVVDGSVKPKPVEERLTSTSSDPFVNDSMVHGEAFHCHYDDKNVFDRGVCSAGIYSLDDTSSEQVYQSCSGSSGTSAEKASQQLTKTYSTIDRSKDIVQELQDDSLGDLCVWLEGKEAVKIDLTNDTTEQTAVYSCDVMDTDCMEESKLCPVSEVPAANRLEARPSQKEHGTFVPTVEEGGIYVSRLSSTAEESPDEAELDEQMRNISTDRGVLSDIAKDSGDEKREQASGRRTKQCEMGSVVRRITRSTTSRKF